MSSKEKYDVIGIGIGPFNLGLAALMEPIEELSAVFFDQSEGFNWHPGLMLSNATLQVPFLGDLVTMADPTSKFSFLNYMKESGRLYRFYIRENFFVLRKEYNAYCQWAVSKLPNCRFSHRVVSVGYDDGLYEVTVLNTRTAMTSKYYAEKLVLGTGTSPYIPDFINKNVLSKVIHTSEYLYYKPDILKKSSVSIIGSGQSAAEVFRDILPATEDGMQLNWFTRSSHFFPLENNAKLTLELTSPEYVDHFYSLPHEKRMQLLADQSGLYKGIDEDLINEIFNTLYEMSVENTPLNVELRSNLELNEVTTSVNGSCKLRFTQTELRQYYDCESDFVILATGYTYKEPDFLKGIEDRIDRMDNGRYNVQRHYTIDNNSGEIFVQNAELHTHGLVTPDLGMGAYRNSCIINRLTDREVYTVEKRIAFQEFGVTKAEDRLSRKEDMAVVTEGIK
ncbi:SidA/IucD/PvdA family monooxygenase [Sinomicrobium kalidii]|uniref:lysine N(6)-hydroxylase/L-ornithine N(5)-oxygenase family protein n=1 Tax=Sinomicrobium kalidii TaxID=2900738 RepID=UPI001E3FDC9D|nr:SidA/IucD/PvdA family monooxygenase [Sinomicrobium kalidii]UGU17582.1 SidA/IucD/PvdA family monooxygenase [Sinomicrobium kalidii]